MANTVKEHFDNCYEVSQIVDDANALLTKTQHELMRARELLDYLIEYQHPKINIEGYLAKRLLDRGSATPADLIRAEVRRINELLGDRA